MGTLYVIINIVVLYLYILEGIDENELQKKNSDVFCCFSLCFDVEDACSCR